MVTRILREVLPALICVSLLGLPAYSKLTASTELTERSLMPDGHEVLHTPRLYIFPEYRCILRLERRTPWEYVFNVVASDAGSKYPAGSRIKFDRASWFTHRIHSLVVQYVPGKATY